MPVDPAFLDMINYGICYVLNERYGKKESETIFREVGRVCYKRMKEGDLIRLKEDPMETLIEIAKFLERMGYMEKILVNKVSENELEFDMFGVSVLSSSAELVGSGRAPSHYMTNIMFAALEDYGIDAELIDLGFEPERNHVKERWILKR